MKRDKKRVIISQTLLPSQIDELDIFCVLVRNSNEKNVEDFILNNGGRVLTAVAADGISKFEVSNFINGYQKDWTLIFSMCQKEITDILMLNLCREFKIYQKGEGKAFVIDVLGYLGAKGPFVEKE